MKILDLGCGTGENCVNLEKKFKDRAEVFGVDISKFNINSAKKNNSNSKIKFMQLNAEKLPFKDNFFDKIFIFEVLEHIEKINKTLSECSRALKIGGQLIITIPTEESEQILSSLNKNYYKQIGHQRQLGKKECADLLKKFSFKLINYKKYNASEHLIWKHLFKKGYQITDENGNLNKPMSRFIVFFSAALNQDNLFNQSLLKRKGGKIFYLSAILLFPISKLMDFLFICKKQKFIFLNERT